MVAFAMPSNMEARTGELGIPPTHPFLHRELDAATQLIQKRCGWHIAPVQQVRHRRVGPMPVNVWLPAMQIQEVSSATVDGVVLDPASVEFDTDTGWTNLTGRKFDITFTAGFEEVPSELVTLTLQIAARALVSPMGLVRDQAGGVSAVYTQVGFNQAGGTVLLSAEEATLTPYRLGRLP